MTIKKTCSIVVSFALFFFISQIVSAAQAATFYVSTSGNDSNDGSQATPFRTFDKAVSSLGTGDDIKIFSGTYNEVLRIGKSGTSGNPIVVSPVSGRPIIDVNYNDHNLIGITGDYIEVYGLEVREAQEPGASDGRCVDVANSSQHITLSDLKVHACKGHGVHIEGQNVVAENLEIYDTNTSFANTGQGSGWGSGLKVRVGGEDITLRNNLIYQNYGEGIAATRGRNITIENNTVYDNFSVNIYVDNSINTEVRNNMSYCTNDTRFYRGGNAARGIEIAEEYYDGWGSQGNNTKVYNNIIDGCYYGITAWDGGVSGAEFRNLQIYNNTIWNIDRTGVSTDSLPTEGTNFFRNNIVQGSNADIYTELSSGFDFRTNHWVSGEPWIEFVQHNTDINGGQPGFATTPNPTNPNSYRLDSSSQTAQDNMGAFGVGMSDTIGYSDAVAPSPTPEPSPSPTIEPTPSPSPSPSPSTCAEDISQNGTVGLEDYSILVSDFFSSNPSNPRSDISGNGSVGLEDYSMLAAKFFQNC